MDRIAQSSYIIQDEVLLGKGERLERSNSHHKELHLRFRGIPGSASDHKFLYKMCYVTQVHNVASRSTPVVPC